MTLNFRFISIEFTNSIKLLKNNLFHICVRDQHHIIIHSSADIQFQKFYQWKQNEAFLAKPQKYYLFQIYNNQNNKEDQYIAQGRFQFSQAQSDKNIKKVLRLKQNKQINPLQVCAITFQVQYNEKQIYIGSLKSMAKEIEIIDDKTKKMIQSRYAKSTYFPIVPVVQHYTTSVINKQKQMPKVEFQHTQSNNINVLTCFDEHPVQSQFNFISRKKINDL